MYGAGPLCPRRCTSEYSRFRVIEVRVIESLLYTRKRHNFHVCGYLAGDAWKGRTSMLQKLSCMCGMAALRLRRLSACFTRASAREQPAVEIAVLTPVSSCMCPAALIAASSSFPPADTEPLTAAQALWKTCGVWNDPAVEASGLVGWFRGACASCCARCTKHSTLAGLSQAAATQGLRAKPSTLRKINTTEPETTSCSPRHTLWRPTQYTAFISSTL